MPEMFEPHHLPGSHPKHRHRPRPWAAYRAPIQRRWAVPFLYLDWLSQWCSYGLSRVSLFELLEYAGSLSILVAVIFYFVDAPQRAKMRHYQAWQVINGAQGKGGSGGRIEALHELNEDHVSLLGVNATDAFLQGVDLRDAELTRADFASADMRNAILAGAELQSANLKFTNLVGADLTRADLREANLDDADLSGADLEGIRNWQSIASLERASIGGVRNAPPGFVQWARLHGATESEATPVANAASTRAASPP